jgi:hypothetical protein
VGAEYYDKIDLLFQLRNKLVHYQSQWDSKVSMAGPNSLFAKLEGLHFEKAPFVDAKSDFWPRRCLSASLAGWAVRGSEDFLNAFYKQLGMPSVLPAHAGALTVAPPKLIP